MRCYGLDRVSEGLDFDGKRTNRDIARTIRDFCIKRNYSCNEFKDRTLLRRFEVRYGSNNADGNLLQIEVSYRRHPIPRGLYRFIDGVYVYTTDELCLLKAQAYLGRDSLKDMYDLCFICDNFYDSLSERTIRLVTEVMGRKGLEQLDYLLSDLGQHDKFIDEDKLAEMFLSTMDKLGQLDEASEETDDGHGC